jgi:hypothetical protein
MARFRRVFERKKCLCTCIATESIDVHLLLLIMHHHTACFHILVRECVIVSVSIEIDGSNYIYIYMYMNM